MQAAELYKTFFTSGTRGYTILSRFYYKYHDLFEKTNFPQFKEFLNQVYLNISAIDFTKNIKNEEAYIIASIKIQCRVQLDGAIKLKNRVQFQSAKPSEDAEENKSPAENIASDYPGPQEQLEINEAFNAVNSFKALLNAGELELINNLIDDVSRNEMAEKINVNLNTLDTRIRRLRIKFAEYLKTNGYSLKVFEKYEK